MQVMRETLRHCTAAAIAVDGPLGPQHHVHHGAIQLASELGHVLVPVAVAGLPRRVIRRRWDQFEIPGLFARVCLIIGDPLIVPTGLSRKDYREWELRVHDALESLGAQAEQRVSPGALESETHRLTWINHCHRDLRVTRQVSNQAYEGIVHGSH